MAKQLQIRRGTTAQNASFTGLVGELSVDTDTDQIRVHDGSTAGGILQGPPLGSIVAVASGLTNAYTLPSTGAVGVGGWQLCDGASIPGAATLSGSAPTLNDGRFLQGNTHANVGGVGAGTKSLSEGELAAHTHTGAAHTHTGAAHTHTGPSHTHTSAGHTHTMKSHTHTFNTNNTGNHSHTVGGTATSYAADGADSGGAPNKYNFNGTPGSTTSSNTGAHSHSGTTAGPNDNTSDSTTPGATGASGTGASGSTTPGTGGSTTPGASGSTGSGTAFDVIPKYLRVVYLIRVQ